LVNKREDVWTCQMGQLGEDNVVVVGVDEDDVSSLLEATVKTC
jgi:hypothetical protein